MSNKHSFSNFMPHSVSQMKVPKLSIVVELGISAVAFLICCTLDVVKRHGRQYSKQRLLGRTIRFLTYAEKEGSLLKVRCFMSGSFYQPHWCII